MALLQGSEDLIKLINTRRVGSSIVGILLKRIVIGIDAIIQSSGGGGGGGVSLGETPSTAYRGDRGKQAYDNSNNALQQLVTLKGGSTETIATLKIALTSVQTSSSGNTQAISNLMAILNSDNNALDTIQEIVNYIENNRDSIDAVLVNKLNKSVYDSFIISNNTALANKVDKDGNKVLSDVNYSTAKDNKLNGIQAGAQVNNTNISTFTTGTLDDARLSTNIPKKINGVIPVDDLPEQNILELFDTAYFKIGTNGLIQPIDASSTTPTVSSVAFTGSAIEGQTLTGTYVYSGGTEGSSVKQWYRSDDTNGLNRQAISGATNSTYVLQAGDIGKYIQFAVTPKNSGGISGTLVYSAYSSVIAASGGGAAWIPLNSNFTQIRPSVTRTGNNFSGTSEGFGNVSTNLFISDGEIGALQADVGSYMLAIVSGDGSANADFSQVQAAYCMEQEDTRIVCTSYLFKETEGDNVYQSFNGYNEGTLRKFKIILNLETVEYWVDSTKLLEIPRPTGYGTSYIGLEVRSEINNVEYQGFHTI